MLRMGKNGRLKAEQGVFEVTEYTARQYFKDNGSVKNVWFRSK